MLAAQAPPATPTSAPPAPAAAPDRSRLVFELRDEMAMQGMLDPVSSAYLITPADAPPRVCFSTAPDKAEPTGARHSYWMIKEEDRWRIHPLHTPADLAQSRCHDEAAAFEPLIGDG